MSDNLEPIRRVFRDAGLYHHAADDLLCRELAAVAAPPAPAVPEDARDAARYRWLVDSGTDTYSMFVEAESKAKLDAAIDAAIAAAQAKGVGRE